MWIKKIMEKFVIEEISDDFEFIATWKIRQKFVYHEILWEVFCLQGNTLKAVEQNSQQSSYH